MFEMNHAPNCSYHESLNGPGDTEPILSKPSRLTVSRAIEARGRRHSRPESVPDTWSVSGASPGHRAPRHAVERRDRHSRPEVSPNPRPELGCRASHAVDYLKTLEATTASIGVPLYAEGWHLVSYADPRTAGRFVAGAIETN